MRRLSGVPVFEEAMSETYVPTPYPSSRQASRLPPPYGRQGRAGCPQGAPLEGAPPSVSLTWRLRGRAAFKSLHQGKTFRSGPLSLAWLPGPSTTPPSVGYAISKRVGNAVARNLLRRRLRELVKRPPGLPPGLTLIRARPEAAQLTFAALGAHTQILLKLAWRAYSQLPKTAPPPPSGAADV